MFYSNRPYALTTARRIATPVTPLSSSSTGSSYIDQSSNSDPHSIDRQLQVRQGRSGTAPTTLPNYTNGDSIDSTTSHVSLPRGNGSAKTNSLTSSRQDKLNVAIEADTKLNDSIDSMTSFVSLPRENSSVKTNSLASSRQDKWNVVIEADTKLNDYLMIYVDDSVQNIGARSFTNVMKDSSLIAKRLKVT